MVDVKKLEVIYEAGQFSVPKGATISKEGAGLIAVHEAGYWEGYKRAKQEYMDEMSKLQATKRSGW